MQKTKYEIYTKKHKGDDIDVVRVGISSRDNYSVLP